MTIRLVTGIKVSEELLIKIIRSLDSVSKPVADKIEQLVHEEVEKVKDHLNFKENNDIGLCVSRILENISGHPEPGDNNEEHYAAARSDDKIVDDILYEQAIRIAQVISSAVYQIRHIVPKSVDAIVARINNILPGVADAHNTAYTEFDWGKLESPAVRAAAIEVAKEKCNSIKTGKPSMYDLNDITSTAMREEVSSIDGIETLGSLFPDSTEGLTVLNILTNVRVFRSVLGSTILRLTGNSLSANIPGAIDQIDSYETILDNIDTSKLSEVIGGREEALMNNIRIVRNVIMFIRASLLYVKEVEMANTLIMSPTVVQKSGLDKFITAGGTPDDVVNHIRYVTSDKIGLEIPRLGVMYTTVLDRLEYVNGLMSKYDSDVIAAKSANDAAALQSAVVTVLNEYFEHLVEDGMTAEIERGVHERYVADVIARLNVSPALEDAITEYCINMTNNKLIRALYTRVKEQLNGLMNGDGSPTTIEANTVAEIVCRSIVNIVLEFLIANFCDDISE